jgi:glycosyltransferase involved in cell wall biosynthesis
LDDSITPERGAEAREFLDIPREVRANPSVTVAIPVLNEEKHIASVINAFSQSGYPRIVEILVADGGSSDGTVSIVRDIARKDRRVRLIPNPERIQSAGLNLMLNEAKGDIFLRADGHSEYAPDYVTKCVEALQTTSAINVGGAQRFIAKNRIQLGIALAVRSWLGSGGAKYRNPEYSGYGDTVFLGCFWRKCLLKVQGFATDLGPNEDAEVNIRSCRIFNIAQITNQDAELNARLDTRTPNAIFISRDIRVWYYPRSSWSSLLKQYFKYGRGRCLTAQRHGWRYSLRGGIPFMGLALFLLTIALAWFGHILPVQIFVGAAILVLLTAAMDCCTSQHDVVALGIWRGDPAKVPTFTSRIIACTCAFVIMLPAHGAGFGYQLLWRRLIQGKRVW